MQSRWFVLRAVLASATLFTPLLSAHADDTQALKDRLHAAEKDTPLSGDDVQPFYLKMSVQLFDAKGAPSEQGTVEVLRAGANREKLVYSFPSYSATEVHTNGSRFRTPDSKYPPLIVSQLVQQVLHPMPQDAAIDGSSPQIQKINLSKLPLDCIMLARPTLGPTPPSIGLFPTYCLDPDNAFRLAFPNTGQVVLRNDVTAFQGKHIAYDVGVTTKGIQVAEAKIITLESRSFTDADFPTDGLPQISDGVPLDGPGSSGPVRVSAGVMQQGLMLSHVDPVYPPGAKMMHVQGTVVLQAQIGTDGHIHDLQVISSPDTELSAAAMDAVRQWTYRPYMLNGSPVAVETTINVNFTFAGR